MPLQDTASQPYAQLVAEVERLRIANQSMLRALDVPVGVGGPHGEGEQVMLLSPTRPKGPREGEQVSWRVGEDRKSVV